MRALFVAFGPDHYDRTSKALLCEWLDAIGGDLLYFDDPDRSDEALSRKGAIDISTYALRPRTCIR